jgi:xanthomonalisin
MFALAAAFALIQPAHGAPSQRLGGHGVEAAVADRALGALPTDKRLKLAVGLPLRNSAALKTFLEDLYNPQSPAYHQYLSVEQFTARFSPSQEDYLAVAAFLADHGFRITGTLANRLLIDVEAAVPDIERTFHLKLRQYQHPTEARAFFAPDSEPSIELAVPLLHISGLDDYVLPRPASLHKVPRHLDVEPQTGSGPGG